MIVKSKCSLRKVTERLKNLIVIEEDRQEQFDTVEELVKALLHPNYYEMTPEEKEKILKLKSAQNSIGMPQNSIIIQDEITYILSLVALDKIILLERKEADLFAKSLDKTQMKNNYIEINFYVKDILRSYLDGLTKKS